MSGAEESSCIVLNVLIPSQNTPMHGLPDICQHIKPVALEAFFCYMQTRRLDNTSCSKATSSDNGIESECALTLWCIRGWRWRFVWVRLTRAGLGKRTFYSVILRSLYFYIIISTSHERTRVGSQHIIWLCTMLSIHDWTGLYKV